MKQRIAIIGVGSVGSTIAHTLLNKNVCAELVLLDKDEQRCAGEVRDLSDALRMSLVSRVIQGTYKEVEQADIIIIAAGRRQKKGESRIDLSATNIQVMKHIARDLQGVKKSALVMLVSNPLDILTHYMQEQIPLPKEQIFGTGTFLDTQRLIFLLSKKTGIAQSSITGFVLGEHGDSQVIAWSTLSLAGQPIEVYNLSQEDKAYIEKELRSTAAMIIEKKGATYYGIASCVSFLCETLLADTGAVIPVSCYHPEFDICLSLPVVLGDKGILKAISLRLTVDERQQLEVSAQQIKDNYRMVLSS